MRKSIGLFWTLAGGRQINHVEGVPHPLRFSKGAFFALCLLALDALKTKMASEPFPPLTFEIEASHEQNA
jgi:hypothetical protein